MFTGIIKEVGTVKKITSINGGKELIIEASFSGELAIDQSISISGVCHTVTACSAEDFTVQSVEETLRKTTTGDLWEGDPVNLERSLTPNQLLDGHLVQGHADTTGTITRIIQEGSDWLFEVKYPVEYTHLIVGRGSIGMDGISLTVARDKEKHFTVAVIPYTYHHTNLQEKKKGDAVNLEFDVLGKYVAKFLALKNG